MKLQIMFKNINSILLLLQVSQELEKQLFLKSYVKEFLAVLQFQWMAIINIVINSANNN